MRDRRLTHVGAGLISEMIPQLRDVIKPLGRDTKPEEVVDYLDSVMAAVDGALGNREGGLVKSRLDRAHIAAYRDALRRLSDSIAEHGVTMHFSGLFSLADRLLAGEQVTFEGEPLEGLQVMGMLETRAIDFDRLIIPSLNERIMPMKSRPRTFIPDSLRVAFGMPPANFRESLFAYYFYRMISRADEVVMLYDARSGGGMRSGDVSRYLLQLKHLYAPETLVWEDRRFQLSAPGGVPQPVEKTERVMELLREFTLGGDEGRNLSASALRKYMDCPVKFYYEVVVGLRADNPPSRHIDSIVQGNIIHDVMMRVYLSDGEERKWLDTPRRVTPKSILSILNDGEGLDRLVRRAINREHFRRPDERLDDPLEGESAMVAVGLRKLVERVLRHDLSLAPFEMYGTEVSGLTRLQVEGLPAVNIKYAIDRIDSVGGIRIVDYKTGRTHLVAEDMEGVMSDDYRGKHIFQLMLYAGLLEERLHDERTSRGIRMEIYEPSRLPSSTPAVPVVGGDKVLSHIQPLPALKPDEGVDREAEEGRPSMTTYNDDFRFRVEDMLREIFDPETPFTPCEGEGACRNCNLASLCKR